MCRPPMPDMGVPVTAKMMGGKEGFRLTSSKGVPEPY
jgi:hypothetical protein